MIILPLDKVYHVSQAIHRQNLLNLHVRFIKGTNVNELCFRLL